MRDRLLACAPLLAAGLALLTVAAGYAPAPHEADPFGASVRQVPGAGGSPFAGAESGAMARSASGLVPVARFTSSSHDAIAPLRRLRQADLIVVAPTSLPRGLGDVIRRLPGVVAAQRVDAARIGVDGKLVAMLGVNPSAFREFAPRPTAESTALWRNVAAGGIAVSYTMGKLDKVPLGKPIEVAGRRIEQLRVAGFGTVGVNGVDAVVSASVARTLGLPQGNAIVISSPKVSLTALSARLKRLIPPQASVAPLVAEAQSSGDAVASGMAGADGPTAGYGALTRAELVTFLRAAVSRVGKRYVWGGAGPNVFDCSGLVQWSLAQAGVVMPRVAVDQARTGPAVPLSELSPGDLLFYHTDPTDPTYISHVAIYLGDGEMIQAPEPGMDVEIVPAVFGTGFAGAVRVYPRIAAEVAAQPPS